MRSRKQPKPLRSGRPPTAVQGKASLSKRVTQKLIRSHHQLHKKLHKAEAEGDEIQARSLEKEINDLGGLESYQLASIQGQSNERGGDSSKVLLQWLDALKPLPSPLRMLEVGALSTRNACSTSGLFDIQRIDLNSQAQGILRQDFMQRPDPVSDNDRFDVISLSLVLNFVPTPESRGAMLRHTCEFLDVKARSAWPETMRKSFPALFLVLPAACILNSRYMTEHRFGQIMQTLGYNMIERKQTAKLIYYLWRLEQKPPSEESTSVTKMEVNPGRNRNNFSIVLDL